MIDTEANGQNEKDLLKVIGGFLKNNAKKQYIETKAWINHQNNVEDIQYSFISKFIARFKTKVQIEV